MALLDFHSAYENFICYSFGKHHSFWDSADVKTISNDLVHAMAWQCMFAPSICIQMTSMPGNTQ